ncbi:MAG: hypothetical protein B1H08_01035 [Candidatus Omnitrophica bacterium 4484_171]|nr:MAG: hypothetical protein B1H08_01035 [Candidatus Omnitrophica bacterium 4484_171]
MRETFISSTANPSRKSILSNGAGGINPYVSFFLLAILLYLPSCLLRGLFYPDEARSLFIARNMHTLADFLFPRYLNGIYYQKPPFYFWILHLLSRIPVNNYLMLPVLLNTFVCFGIMSLNYLFFKKEGAPDAGFLSSIMLSTTVIFYGMGILVRMDILFLFLIFLSLYFLWAFIKEGKEYQLIFSASFIFLSVFTKGAFGIIFPLFLGVGAALFLKERNSLPRALLANGLGALFIIIWLSVFNYVHPGYITHMVFTQTLARGVSPFSHKQPFYYYLMFLIPLFLPWSFIGMGYFSVVKKRTFSFLEKLLMLWFAGGFLILSMVSSKLPMYLLLLTIPFAGLCAQFLVKGKERHKFFLLYVTVGFFVLVFICACIYFKVKKEFIPGPAYIAIVLFLAAAVFMFKRKADYKFRAFFIAWFVFIQLMNFIYLPLASRHYDYNGVAEFLKKANFDISKIYVDEEKLLLLSAYSLKAKVVYVKSREDFAKEKDIIFISRNRKPILFSKVAKIGSFFIFYR